MLLRVTVMGEHRHRLDIDRATESIRWVHRDREPGPDVGLPRAVLGPQDAREHLPRRDFAARRRPDRLPARLFEAAPGSPC